jgi:hypothetical protein
MARQRSTNSTTDQGATFDRSFVDQVVEMLKHHKHVFEAEQQTGHRTCAWCGDCDEPSCSHYWKGRA